VEYGTGGSPPSVAIGDLSGDGKPDLVAANYGSNTVSVLLGNGDGTFGANVDYGTGSNPLSAAIADVNGDGKLDLAVANNGSTTVSVLVGNGDGSFGAKVDYGTGSNSHPASIAVGDVNGDGKPDIVTANSGSNSVSVLLGSGNGTFGGYVDYGTGSGPFSVAMGDVSGDGKPDLAVANSNSNTISILLGNGDGTFGAKVDYGTGLDPLSVAIGDVSGDGKPDLAVANFGSNTVSILLNIGPRSQALAVVVDLDPNTINLKSHAPWVSAYIEPSSGFDLTSIDISTVRLAGSVTAGPKSAVVADHNGNGIPDLVLKFSRAALDPLLTPGMNELEVTGSLVTGEKFEGSDEVGVINPPTAPVSASVAPNPFNPAGVLSFETSRPGPLRVAIFDVQGRMVRVLMDTPALPMGRHAVPIDGRTQRGQMLTSGLYFYRVEAGGETVTGRIVILK
jgi:hypothetical protein